MVHILVAEDQEYFRTRLVRQLEEAGHVVEAVDDGVAAYRQLLNNEYDLVICDNQMPRMNGLDVLRRLRTSGKKKDTPFVLYPYEGKIPSAAWDQVEHFGVVVVPKLADTAFPVSRIPEFMHTTK